MPKVSRAITQMPPATVAGLEKLGADLAVARLRRRESLKTWAVSARASAEARLTRQQRGCS
jgi:hypothetical protein